ncbi:class I SAM-dependent methyltransferase [Xylanibacillus composti]|uniref:SAM-dependent methyltransferase n=1 Tax=Xylanibacillus composti TaxID=1572762 RepID=A0A8J4GZR8_9BACL|nr:class I SAM-dependent methyltransferase [Xylanibacillus composti]MDT9724950.1 class I SAM-dependent methyltransferase [Xylanibacillus composti]GIQ68189.1 SAM-dependent methyltransferase [Xylanibacillus composti]
MSKETKRPASSLSKADEQAGNESRQPRYDQAGIAMTCRSYAEYAAMFDLGEDKSLLKGPVLDVAGGASSFAAELCEAGVEALAADPRYALSPKQILQEAEEEIRLSTAKLDQAREHFDWDYYGSLEQHEQLRRQSLERFGSHYSSESRQQAYVPASLPNLPFADDRFALVVCSHFLFLYGDVGNEDFHAQALSELLRVCRPSGEVRIYPLVSLPEFRPYPELDALLERLPQELVEARLVPSRLPFIPGSHTQLVLKKKG